MPMIVIIRVMTFGKKFYHVPFHECWIYTFETGILPRKDEFFQPRCSDKIGSRTSTETDIGL